MKKGQNQKDNIGNLFLWNQPIIFSSMYFCLKVKGNKKIPVYDI